MRKVLVVDDDSALRFSVESALKSEGFQVFSAGDGEEALKKVRAEKFNLVLLDVNMPKMTGMECLKEIKAYDPSIIVIMLTAYSNVRDAVEATKEGAYNYLEKPIISENLVYIISRALKAHSLIQDATLSAPQFIGTGDVMKHVFSTIDKLSRVDTAVLIRGESGTGKELVANAIHFNGPRKDQPFVAINCSAIPENLIESELFGHEKGAFTGADQRKTGKFQQADGGTIFLDEIGDITPAMQVKLLRVLQEKKFTPVGSHREIETNVRIVAATNRPLEAMVKENLFREDLFYRLNVIPIFLPPLRERKDDLEPLIFYFIKKFNTKHNKTISGISEAVLEKFKTYTWPGNIRELENVIEYAFIMESGYKIDLESLPEKFFQISDNEEEGNSTLEDPSILGEIGFKVSLDKLDFQANKEVFEREFLISALKAFQGRINRTAMYANIPKKTLLRKLEKYGIKAKDYNSKDDN